MIKKGTLVKIKDIVLKADQRTAAIPEDTKKTDLVLNLNGILQHDSALNEIGEIKTNTGRLVKGIIIEQNPHYTHSFGRVVEEIHQIDDYVRSQKDGI